MHLSIWSRFSVLVRYSCTMNTQSGCNIVLVMACLYQIMGATLAIFMVLCVCARKGVELWLYSWNSVFVPEKGWNSGNIHTLCVCAEKGWDISLAIFMTLRLWQGRDGNVVRFMYYWLQELMSTAKEHRTPYISWHHPLPTLMPSSAEFGCWIWRLQNVPYKAAACLHLFC